MTPTAPARLGDPARDRGSGRVFTAEWDGRPVLVRRLPGSPDRAVRARVDLLAARLVGLEGPGLVPVLAIASDWAALDLIQASPPVVGSLATFSHQHPLRPGEVVGVGLRLAGALQLLHTLGLTHGRLHAGDVLVGTDGEVLLTGYGVAGVLGSAGTAAEDVRDLAGLLLLLCPDDATAGRLPALLRTALADDEEGVHGLLAALGSCGVRPEALRTGHGRLPVPRPHPGSHRHRDRSRVRSLGHWLLPPTTPWRACGRLLPAALGVVILAGWLGVRSAPEPTPTAEPALAGSPAPTSGPALGPARRPAPAPAATPAAVPPRGPPTAIVAPAVPDWRVVVDELNRRRAALLGDPDPARIAGVDAPGSSAFASDAALVRALRARGAAARGADTQLVSLRARSVGPVRTDVAVVDRLAAHTIVSASGQVLEQRPGRAARSSVLVLVRGDDGWRVAQVLAR